MFKVKAMLQTFNGSITRTVAEIGGDDALERAEAVKTYWMSQETTLLVWIE